MSKYRVPTLGSSDNIVIRQTEDKGEIEGANRLIFGNYVSAKYWENDAKNLQNKFLHTPMRKVIVALEDNELIGTISVILDSPIGLPSDCAQQPLMQQLRMLGGTFAEVSGFAMEKSKTAHRKMALFMMSYMFQYAYHYAGVDRLVASCIAAHAKFYESSVGFSRVKRISGPTRYDQRSVSPFLYLLTLNLKEVCSWHAEDNFYRFMFQDPQVCQHFPPERLIERPREINRIGCPMVEVA